jgi:hypothetical protein
MKAISAFLAAWGVALCLVVPGAGQNQPATKPGATAVDRLAGRWTLDDNNSLDDQKNWRRPVSQRPTTLDTPAGLANPLSGWKPPQTPATPPAPAPQTPQQAPPPSQPVSPQPPLNPKSDTSSRRRMDEATHRRTMRDLLEIAEGYVVRPEADRVTVTDDLGRALVFMLDGRKTKHRLGGTEFTSRSRWEDARLTVDIEAEAGFKMSQVFLPAEDGAALFVGMVVTKPQFTPALKNIQRVYRRAPSATPAALNAASRSRHLLQRPH